MSRRKTMFYKLCNECGAALDPGERCDCMNRGIPKYLEITGRRNAVLERKKTLQNKKLFLEV